MNLLVDVYNLLVFTHVRIKIYREFYHGIIYIANEGRHFRIPANFLSTSSTTWKYFWRCDHRRNWYWKNV